MSITDRVKALHILPFLPSFVTFAHRLEELLHDPINGGKRKSHHSGPSLLLNGQSARQGHASQ